MDLTKIFRPTFSFLERIFGSQIHLSFSWICLEFFLDLHCILCIVCSNNPVKFLLKRNVQNMKFEREKNRKAFDFLFIRFFQINISKYNNTLHL